MYLRTNTCEMKRWLLLACLFSFPLIIFAQNTLLLDKVGYGKRFYYRLDDFIRLKTKKGFVYRDYLNAIYDSSILVGAQYDIDLKDIVYVERDHRFLKKLGKYTFAAGALYIIITSINALANNEQVFTPTNLIIGGAVMASGGIMIPLSRHRYKIGLTWKLKVINRPLIAP